MRHKESEEPQEDKAMQIVRQLNAFTKKVREDVANKRISEADGQKLILKAAMTISVLTKA